MATRSEDYHYTYTLPFCSLCLEPVDLQDVNSFLAVSSCSGPGRANWSTFGGMHYLCIGRTAATMIQRSGKLPDLYLLHPYCNSVMPPISACRRSLFSCIRDLDPTLNETTKPRDWPWRKSSRTYAPALRAVISGLPEFQLVKQMVELRVRAFKCVTERLPLEIADMILDYLPVELAVALSCISAGYITSSSLSRLRCDPIARRLEQAFDILGHPRRQLQSGRVKLAQEMMAQFVKLGGCWYLEGLHPSTKQREAGREHIIFQHDSNQKPYIGIQVNEFGITHIALGTSGGEPQWISPNAPSKHVECFQDLVNAEAYHDVFVVSDVRISHQSW